MDETLRLLREMAELQRQQIANQQQLLDLHKASPKVLQAVANAVGGRIAGRVGLDFKRPDDNPPDDD